MRKLLVVSFAFFCLSAFADSPSDFTRAKKIALGLFEGHQTTLYCHCQYSANKDVDLHSCHMDSANGRSRANRMEWEHMVPASHLGRGHACWTENLCTSSKGHKYHGRSCCERIDKAFRHKESELFNLWLADGVINQMRQDYDFANLSFEKNSYGCQFGVDNQHHLVEPDDSSKGVVARASLFMAEHHGISWSDEQIALFNNWNAQFPPSQWERQWEQAVAKIEGYHNHFITDAPLY